VPLMSRAIRVI